MGLQSIAHGMQHIPLDDENYYKDRHDGFRQTTDNYKQYFLKKNPHRLNSTVMSKANKDNY